MNHHTQDAAGAFIGAGIILIFILFGLAAYLFFCFCNKRICENCGVRPGLLIWIPILNVIPLFWAAKMSAWLCLLLLVPIVGLIIYIMLWVKVCEVRGKGVLGVVLVLLIPVVGVPYLAFSS
jgi:hypothetical protein